MAKRSGLGFRKQKKLGKGTRVTVTHRGVGMSQRIPGTGLSVSSKRGLTLFGRKPWKGKKGAGCAGLLLALVLVVIIIACTSTAAPPAVRAPEIAPLLVQPAGTSMSQPIATRTPRPILVAATRSPATQAPLVPTKMPATTQPPAATAARTSWPCPDSTEGAAYIGNTNSGKFHTVAHAINSKVSAEHRLCFSSREAAVAAGYDPCGTCKP